MKKSIITHLASLILVVAAILSIFCTSASAASTNVIRYNVSTSAVSCNATAGSLPTSKTSLTGGSCYYFNVQVSSDLKLSKAKLYIKDVGESSYGCIHTETAGSYMRYVYYKYQVNNSTGTLYYYWKLYFTDGTTSLNIFVQ